MRLDHLRAFIADDNRGSREIVVEVLRSAGLRQIRHAKDGADIFEMICQQVPDLVILDFEIHSDGIRALRQVRTSPVSPDRRLPVVVLTSYSTRARIEAIRDAGATEIVTKPLSRSKLIPRIARMLERPREFIEVSTFVGPDRRHFPDPNYPGPFRRLGEAGQILEIA